MISHSCLPKSASPHRMGLRGGWGVVERATVKGRHPREDDRFRCKILGQICCFSFPSSQCRQLPKYLSKRMERVWGDPRSGEGLRLLLEVVTSSSSEGRGPAEETSPPPFQNSPGSGTPGSRYDQFATVQGDGGLRPHRDKPPMMLLPPDPSGLLMLPDWLCGCATQEPRCCHTSHQVLAACPGSQRHVLERASPAGLTLASLNAGQHIHLPWRSECLWGSQTPL